MDPVHCHVFCRKIDGANQFIVRDVSDHTNELTTGVWVELSETETDLMEFDYADREYSVLSSGYVFKLSRLDEEVEPGICKIKIDIIKGVVPEGLP